MNRARILVTGANGQLGSELRELSEKVDDFEFTFVDVDEMDFTREDAIRGFLEGKSFDFIVNTAAFTQVDEAESKEDLAFAINARAVSVLCDVCRQSGSRLIHISTDYVFDGQGCTPLRETDTPNPQSVYGRSKLEGERIVLGQLPDAYVIRTSWLYSSFGKNFVKTISRLASERDSLNVVSDQVGSPTYARDLALAVIQVMRAVHQGRVDVPGIYHYANEGVASWYDLACAVVRIKAYHCVIQPIRTDEYPVAARRPAYSVLDKRKIRTTFDIEIPNWYDALMRCLGKPFM
ncbi:MAG: dTDP-4-dehydrorhamnose reductase [Cyclobacteriaceae bacterium]|jgi:dTDP-4-dehydrorhamnose reductase|nr:dTDP-4-dehydrorhamnose reductase [Cyclobacteriaceae bacterium]